MDGKLNGESLHCQQFVAGTSIARSAASFLTEQALAQLHTELAVRLTCSSISEVRT